MKVGGSLAKRRKSSFENLRGLTTNEELHRDVTSDLVFFFFFLDKILKRTRRWFGSIPLIPSRKNYTRRVYNAPLSGELSRA